MAFATLYRFQINLSDVDRGIYESIDFRAAQHPSEAPVYLLTRVFAFILNFRDGLAFSPEGLGNPDAPALQILDPNGSLSLWIEIGNPSARKLHKASKAAAEVKVYTYKNPELLLSELSTQHIHQAENIGIYSIDPKFLERLIALLDRNNQWSVMHSDGSLIVTTSDERLEQTELKRHYLLKV